MTTATVRVLTFKEGLLSRVAHDLQLCAERAELHWEGDVVQVEVDASSLRVDHAMKKGRPDPSALKTKDKAEIERTLRNDVLHTARFPRIRFTGEIATRTDTRLVIVGQLELHGTSKSMRMEARRSATGWTLRQRLHQPDFGIEPYSAMMGALKVKPGVDVLVDVSGR